MVNPLWPKVRYDEQQCFFITFGKETFFSKGFLFSLFRFYDASESQLPTGPSCPASSESEFHPTEEVNWHLFLIRLMVSKTTHKASFDHKTIFKMNFIIFVQFLSFTFCVITLICDTNVKYFNTPVFEGVQKSVFILCVK